MTDGSNSESKEKSKGVRRIIPFLVGAGLVIGIIFFVNHLFSQPETRLEFDKPVHFKLNSTNGWSDQRAVVINLPTVIYPDLHPEVNVTIPAGLEKEERDMLSRILVTNPSLGNVDPRRLDIYADASTLNMPTERITYNGTVSLKDKSNVTMGVIDVIIDIMPLKNYGISLDTTTVQLILNSKGNSTDHKIIIVENPLKLKLNHTIHSINTSLTTQFERLVNVTAYPRDYTQKISIDAFNGPIDSPILMPTDAKRSYYGYIELQLYNGETVGVIDLRIDLVK